MTGAKWPVCAGLRRCRARAPPDERGAEFPVLRQRLLGWVGCDAKSRGNRRLFVASCLRLDLERLASRTGKALEAVPRFAAKIPAGLAGDRRQVPGGKW